MKAPTSIYVIVNRHGQIRGYAYASEARAKADLHNAREDWPEDTPHRIQEYRSTE